MKKIYTIFVTFSFFVLPHILTQAQTISYEYDASGNRIACFIVPLSGPRNLADNATMDQDNRQPEEEKFIDEEGTRKIQVYPNPTKGKLYIELTGYDLSQPSGYDIMDVNGKLLLTRKPLSEAFEIDLSGEPDGVYILKIVIGDKASLWKILKN